MIDFLINDNDNMGILTMAGEMTVERAVEVKAALMKAFDKVDKVVINLEKVTELDLSFLQLLCSAQQSSVIRNKRLTIDNHLPEVFRQTVENAGFSLHIYPLVTDTKVNCGKKEKNDE